MRCIPLLAINAESPEACEIGLRLSQALAFKKDDTLNVCLISPLTMIDFGDTDLTLSMNSVDTMSPPLGVLSLAATLCDIGITPQVININKLFLDFFNDNGNFGSSDFLAFILRHIEPISLDILGLGTKCNSYPLTLRIAREVKRLHPNIKIILGGPQASVVDMPTMRAFPFIDYIVRGEAEDTFPNLLKALSGMEPSQGLEKIPGITFRKGESIIRNPNASPILDLDRLPMPAYHLDPSIKDYKNISLEVGRGCPFSCTFCSTSSFFSRKFRLKSPQKIVEQMMFIKDRYGVNNIAFNHDNFVVDRRKIIEFCEALQNCGEDFYWSCSARTDQVDDELITIMSKAGCQGIFFGVETGSPRLQKKIKKNLNLSDAVRQIQCADQHGIKTAVALITGFPEETKDDLRDTISFFFDMLRFDNVEPQLSLLGPLVGTKLHSRYENELILDYIYSDVSFQGKMRGSDDLEMIQAYPDVFPNFYSIPTLCLDRIYFKEVMDFVTALHEWFRWLPLALNQDSGDMLNVFDRWRLWHISKNMENSDTDACDGSYYNGRQFPHDFIKFVQICYNNDVARAKEVISAVIQIEDLYLKLYREPATKSCKERGVFSLTSFPYKPAGLHLARLEVDYKELLMCLRNRKSLEQVPMNKTTIALQEAGGSKKETNVLLLSPLSEELLSLSDGWHTVSDIINRCSLSEAYADGISPDRVLFFGLVQLFKQGLIEVSSRPIREISHAADLESSEHIIAV